MVLVGPLPPPVMGPAICTQMMRDAFVSAGVDVVHVNTQDDRTVFNVGVFDLRNVYLGLLHAAQLGWRALRHRPDFVYIPISQMRWGYVRDAVLIAIARVLRRRVVVHLHGANFQSFYASSNRFDRWLIRKTLSWVSIAIASTPRLRSVFDGLVDPRRVRVLENGIPDPWPHGVDSIQRARGERALREPNAMRLLYIANDFATKGAATAIRVLAEPGIERCELVMIGSPPPEVADATMSLAKELGCTGRVHLCHGVSDARKLRELEAADAFVYPTENDAQPLVVLEAMAAGLPIVASTYGGVPDTLSDAGITVVPGDPAAIAEQLRGWIADPEPRAALGRRARERFESRYSPSPFRDRSTTLLAELVAAP